MADTDPSIRVTDLQVGDIILYGFNQYRVTVAPVAITNDGSIVRVQVENGLMNPKPFNQPGYGSYGTREITLHLNVNAKCEALAGGVIGIAKATNL